MGRDLTYIADATPSAESDATEGSAAEAGLDAARPTAQRDASIDAPGEPDAALIQEGGGSHDAGTKPGPPTCLNGTASEVEPNDSIPTANALVIGRTCGALGIADTDYFTVDFGDKGQMNVNFYADEDGRMLMQAEGGGIAFATGTGGSFNFSTNGKWNIRVVSDTGQAQKYYIDRR